MKPFDTCVHEAGHIVVATKLLGPCITAVRIDDDGSGAIRGPKLDEMVPVAAGALVLAGAVADHTFTRNASHERCKSDLEMFDEAYFRWSGGVAIGIERMAFERAALNLAKRIVWSHRHDLIELAKHLSLGGELPEKYMHPDLAELKRLQRQLEQHREHERRRTEHKAVRDQISDAFVDRLEASHYLVNDLSNGMASRAGWGA